MSIAAGHASAPGCVYRPCPPAVDAASAVRRLLQVLEGDGREIVPGMAASVTVPSPFSAPAVEEVCKVLADAVTGDQIPNLIAPLKVPEEPDGPGTKWKRLFNAVVARQNKSQDGKALVRLVLEVMAPVRFGSAAEFEPVRTQLHDRLLLSRVAAPKDGV